MPRISAAAARRHRRELLATKAADPGLPEDLRAYLDRYRPNITAVRQHWPAIQERHHEIMERCATEGLSSFKHRCCTLAAYLAWRQERDMSIEIADALVDQAIVEYCRAVEADYLPASASTRRSHLMRLAQQANPELAALVRPKTAGYQAVQPPYDERDEAIIKRIALRQRRPTARRSLSAVVGLSGGAGLSSMDMRGLYRHHITDLAADGIRVEVPGPRARVVWVRRDYEELVRVGIESLGSDELVIGRKAGRRNIAAAVIARAEIVGNVPPIDADRLRTTWLRWLCSRPVPVSVILTAAGLTSARTLSDLVPHLPATPDPRRHLQGEEIES